jgi:hypothetical protein
MPALYDSTTTYDASALSFDGGTPPLANMPAVGVFIAWDDTPYEASPVWTEISHYVRQISIRRGRQDDLQQFGPGTASLTLDNRDSQFDPMNTGSPYNLKPRRQIRIVANWNGTEYSLFRGFVSGWPVEYTEAGLDSTVTIDCFDLMGLLATETFLLDWPQYETELLGARRYYKFNDTVSTGTILDQSATSPSLPLGIVVSEAIESQPLMTGIRNNCIDLAGTSALINTVVNSSTQTHNFTLSFVASFHNVGTVRYGRDRTQLNFYYDLSTDRYTLEVENYGSQRTYVYGGLPSSSPAHFAIAVTGSGVATPTAVLYINGVAEAELSSSTATVSALAADEYADCSSIKIQEWSIYTGILTATQINRLNNALMGRYVETTATRMQRLINETSIPVGLYSLTSASKGTVAEIGVGTTAFVEMQRTNDSENGALFVDRLGVLQFYERDYWASQARSSTAQFSLDNSTGVNYADQSLRYDLNADQISNDVNVQFSGGGIYTVRDATSIAEYGAAQRQIATLLDSPTSASSLAERLLTIYKNPKVNLEPLLVKGQADASYNWPRLLAIELLDRISFSFNPPLTSDPGSTWTKELLIQSIEHRITPGEWQTVVNGSARYTNWFIIGSSLIGGDDLLLN